MLVNHPRILICILALLAVICCTPAGGRAADTPYRMLTTAEVKKLWDAKAAMLLIDTRNPEEYNDVHIPGAINIPQKKFSDHIGQLPTEKAYRLIFYCNGLK
jgi:3-mercaptopyruvate sulfurtransferase SseA